MGNDPQPKEWAVLRRNAKNISVELFFTETEAQIARNYYIMRGFPAWVVRLEGADESMG